MYLYLQVRREGDPREGSEHILALNKIGVSFLDLITHETMLHYPFTEVISTRKVQTDDGTLYLDMKCGKFGFVQGGCPSVKAPLLCIFSIISLLCIEIFLWN